MANRSDRDPLSLHDVLGTKPTGELRRGSADSIRASGKKTPHQQAGYKAAICLPVTPKSNLASREASIQDAMILKRAWTVWCSPEERAAIRARARAAGVPISRLVLDLAFAEAGSHDEATLTAEEMAELLGGFRMLVAFMRMVKGEDVDAGGSGAGPGDGTAVSEDLEKGGRLPAERTRLSVSATEEEWTAIRERARRHGLSVSRYLVGLVLPDGSAPGLRGNPLPALGGMEQRELLEAARHMRLLLSNAEEGGAALSGMREWAAAPRDTGVPAPAGPDDEEESGTARLSGEEPAEPGSTASALHSPGAAGRPERAGRAEAGSPPEPGPRKQGALF